MASQDDGAATPRPPLAYRLTSRQRLMIDSAMALGAVGWAELKADFADGFRYQGRTAMVALLAAAATVPVAVRRIWPVPVLLVVTVAVASLTSTGRAPFTVDVMIGMAIYLVAVRAGRPVSLLALILTEVVLGAGVLAAMASSHAQADAMHSLLAAGALWFIGDSLRARRRYIAGLAEQAEHRRRAEDDGRRRAIREERVRIARELHDIVAHSLTVVTVRAGVGRRVMDERPDEARKALEAVEGTGRGALAGLRPILGLVRADDAAHP